MARIIPIPIGPIFPGGPCRGIIHVIQKGDTLYQLGKRYHVSVGQLMFANPFVDVYNLQIGDELCIPASVQPRTIGAKERLEYQNIDHWAERDDHDDWDNHDDWDDRDKHDGHDWDDRDKHDDHDWDDRDKHDDHDWDDRDKHDDHDWDDRDKHDGHDWDDRDRHDDHDWDDNGERDDWDDHDDHDWKNRNGWHANYDWEANR